jgi:hypothetical protein
MSSHSGRLGAMILGVFLLGPGSIAPSPRVHAQEATRPAKDTQGKWFPLFQRHAREFAVRVGADGKEDARRLAEPLLRWSQPVRGGDDGAVYLWVREGRPVAVVSYFTYKWPDGRRVILHERHSLTIEPIEVAWRGRTVGHTSQPGVKYRPILGAPTPADTPAARLRQMRTFLRAFSANTVDDKGSTWPLRPLIQPLFRYESQQDGALFAMAQGTDPEVFLLLEVRGEGKAARWEYAVARFTDLEIHVRLDDHEVFSGPRTLGAEDRIYHSHDAVERKSDSPEDFP